MAFDENNFKEMVPESFILIQNSTKQRKNSSYAATEYSMLDVTARPGEL